MFHRRLFIEPIGSDTIRITLCGAFRNQLTLVTSSITKNFSRLLLFFGQQESIIGPLTVHLIKFEYSRFGLVFNVVNVCVSSSLFNFFEMCT